MHTLIIKSDNKDAIDSIIKFALSLDVEITLVDDDGIEWYYMNGEKLKKEKED